MTWVSEELASSELGDERRKARLIRIVEDLAASPESSVPLASRDRAALPGIYDFWSNRRINAAGIVSGHIRSSVERAESYGVVLAVQDTSELDYSRQREIAIHSSHIS